MRRSLLVQSTVLGLLVACGGGGGGAKVAHKPASGKAGSAAPKAPETEADREKARLDLAATIVPKGAPCLPASLKEASAPRLELGAVGKEPIVCAFDQEQDRLLGSVACWKIDLATGKLEYKDPAPLPGRGFSVKYDGKCARSYCLPDGPKVGVGYLATNIDGSKVAVLDGDDVHVFNAETKAHETSFSIQGDKGVSSEPRAMHFVADKILVEGAEGVWVFKADGTALGPITQLGGKGDTMASTRHGSFSILDKARVALSDRAMSTVNTYDVNTGARAKLVRKLPKFACKPGELDAYWADSPKAGAKCKASVAKATGPLEGATAVAGAKNLLVLLRGDRLGELGVLDAKSLAESKVIKMPWCEIGDGSAKPAEAPAPAAKK